MTRIVSGFAGSLSLSVPHSGTRPTSDRVREAIFSALEARDALTGRAVLDLYAGSGALGLESASRGAASVTLVERSAAAARVCRTNIAAIIRAARAEQVPTIEVRASSVRAYLGAATGSFDLVFLDPPYDLVEDDLTEDLNLLHPLLSDDAIVIVERSTRSPEPTWPAGLILERRRNYGETAVFTATLGET